MAMEATQTSTTLWKVSLLGSPRSMMLATATRVEAKAAQRQPPLSAKARTEPAVQIDGRVGPSMCCFVLGNPISPVWKGEIQTRGLGMAVEAFDDNGHAVRGEKGELVCTRS